MRIAFKEWAVVVDALGRGEQTIILRKGGIHEGREGFQVEHEQFLLFPTLFHQQRDCVIAPAQARYDQISAGFSKETVVIEFCAEVVGATLIRSAAMAEKLQGQHIWTDSVLNERFEWGKEKSLHALTVRVYRLPQKTELPMLAEYGGCKSWVTLVQDIDIQRAQPVLSDVEFAEKLIAFNSALRINTLV